jgi:hypothetical protein
VNQFWERSTPLSSLVKTEIVAGSVTNGKAFDFFPPASGEPLVVEELDGALEEPVEPVEPVLPDGAELLLQPATLNSMAAASRLDIMLMYGKEASNRKQEIDCQYHTIPNQRPKDKHYGNVHNRLFRHG